MYLCTPLTEGSHELECLLEQRNYLPPADIGSLLENLREPENRWKNRTDGSYEELIEMAQNVDDSVTITKKPVISLKF